MLVRDRLIIDRPYLDELRAVGLANVGAVLDALGDHLAAWSRTSDTIRYDTTNGRAYYIKRYHYPRWRHRIRGAFRGTYFGVSRARNEYRTLHLMRSLGIQAVRPVAYGERRIAHFLRSCFLMTEAVPNAMPLSGFIQSFSSQRSSIKAVRLRRKLLSALARQVRHMHQAGFIHRDLFWRNVLIRWLPDDTFEFYFLDASVGKRVRLAQRRQEKMVHDIAAMGALAPAFCSRADQLRFLLEYLGSTRLDAQQHRWLRRVQTESDGLRDVELRRLRRGQVFDPPIQRELVGV